MRDREAKRRDQIIRAVSACVARYGIEGSTIRKVAQHARVSPGMLNYYYRNKREMIADALASASRLFNERIIERAGAENSVRRLETIFDVTFIERPREIPPLSMWLEAWAHASRDPELRRDHARAFAAGRESMRNHVLAGIQNGDLRPDIDPDAAADILFALFCGLQVQVAINGDDVPSARAGELGRAAIDLFRTAPTPDKAPSLSPAARQHDTPDADGA